MDMYEYTDTLMGDGTLRRSRFAASPFATGTFRRHLNLITAVMIDSIFTEYATHIFRNLHFILDH
jgi:hypothetical protein